MRADRNALIVAVALAACPAHAAASSTMADPLAAIDLHRATIIADIVQGYPGDRALLTKRLSALRADHLLSASLASSRNALEVIVSDAEKSNGAALGHASAKVLGSATTDLVYTPLTPCRLIDTRGFGAPIQGGVFAPNERRAYVPNGLCGLPVTGVASMLVSFTTENLTPNSGGYLAILGPAAPVTASVDVFNLGAEWSASNTAVKTGSAAQFDVLVAVANAHVIVDILGYFAPSTIGNLTLADPSTPSAGTIMKGASSFIHNYGTANTFIGKDAGNFTMTGLNNTAIGVSTLALNTSGSGNTASGVAALVSNTTGSGNTASGLNALISNSSGSNNTASGFNALYSNTTASSNTASGFNSLYSNTLGAKNTASGFNALYGNTIGASNTAIGMNALSGNTTGGGNSATGQNSLVLNTIGTNNTANGVNALYSSNANNNTAVGAGALFGTTGGGNIALGNGAGEFLTTGSFNIHIGNQGVAGESNTIRIGDTNQTRTVIAGIRGFTTGNANAVPVLIDSQSQLGTINSSRRFKDDIADMEAASSALMKLRPVTFHYKADQDPAGRTLQYGLIAEEVAEVYPGLIAYSRDGQVETVMYQFLPPMLLNEYQKLRRTVDDQAAEIAALKEAVAQIGGLRR